MKCQNTTNHDDHEKASWPKGVPKTQGDAVPQTSPGYGSQPMRYAPKDETPALWRDIPSCDYCRHNDGICRAVCADIRGLLANDQTGKHRREYTNELNLDGHTTAMTAVEGSTYGELLKVPWIYTRMQLTLLSCLNRAMSREEICRELGVSNSRISQLKRAALARHLDWQAELRAKTMAKYKELVSSEDAEDGMFSS